MPMKRLKMSMASSWRLVPAVALMVALVRVGEAFLLSSTPKSTSTATPAEQSSDTSTSVVGIVPTRHISYITSCRSLRRRPHPTRSSRHCCAIRGSLSSSGDSEIVGGSRICSLHRRNRHDNKRFGAGVEARSVKGVRVSAARTKGEVVEVEDDIDEVEDPMKIKNDQEWQFFDTARINVKAGMGGNGCVAMRREKGIALGGPNGGSGGRGGSIFLRCHEGLNTLAAVRHKVHYRATDGQNGQGKSRTGNAGTDVFVYAPVGTVVRDQDGTLCGELTRQGQELLIARGGRGGRGNEAFKTNRARAPKLAENGEPGGERWLSLELKLVADVGLVGVPNAGKSTLLAVSSNAKPKIADYPFTTVTPNLGVCDVLGDEGAGVGLVLADIPGLLEGAHAGVGLGLAFLRHVQRCRALIHVVSGDSVDPVGDYRAIQQELELFSPKLLEKKQVVVLNKIDLPHVREKQAELEDQLKAELGHSRFMSISAVAGENTAELMRRVRKLVTSLPPVDDLFDGEAVRALDSPAAEDTGFDIETDPAFPGQFRVTGDRIVRIARMTVWDYYEAVQRFQRVMEAMGVDNALRKAGARAGDLIMIDKWDFEYQPNATSVYLQGLKDIGQEEGDPWGEEEDSVLY